MQAVPTLLLRYFTYVRTRTADYTDTSMIHVSGTKYVLYVFILREKHRQYMAWYVAPAYDIIPVGAYRYSVLQVGIYEVPV